MSTSLKQAIENAKARVSAAFDAVVAKGGTKPSVANLAALPSAIESIPSGGGEVEVPIKEVTFIDFDGTVLYSYDLDEINTLTEMPADPKNRFPDYIRFTGWTHTLADIQHNGEQVIGAMYELKEPNDCYWVVDMRTRYATVRFIGNYIVDWGDGVVDNISTQYFTHEYNDVGIYTIHIHPTGTASMTFLHYTNLNVIYRFGDYGPNACYSYAPQNVVYPDYKAKVIYQLGSSFRTIVNMMSLEWLVIGKNCAAPQITGYTATIQRLKMLVMNDTTTTMPSIYSYSCPFYVRLSRLLNRVNITDFSYNLMKLYLPPSVESYTQDNSIAELKVGRSIVEHGSITTMTNSPNVNYLRKVIVPLDSVDAYKSATNWSVVADRIIGE